MPSISVAFASIGLCHGVLCSFGRFWANFRAIVENTTGRPGVIERAPSGKYLFVVET